HAYCSAQSANMPAPPATLLIQPIATPATAVTRMANRVTSTPAQPVEHRIAAVDDALPGARHQHVGRERRRRIELRVGAHPALEAQRVAAAALRQRQREDVAEARRRVAGGLADDPAQLVVVHYYREPGAAAEGRGTGQHEQFAAERRRVGDAVVVAV